MQPLYDYNAPKKSANLSLNGDLLSKAKALKINLSATLEQVLKGKLAKNEEKEWSLQNKHSIVAYNDFVEENGCFSDDYRDF